MIREIVQLGDKVLRETCAPVEKFDEELMRLLDDMNQPRVRVAEGGADGPRRLPFRAREGGRRHPPFQGEDRV